MARIGVGLGGQAPAGSPGGPAPGGMPEHWMRPWAEKRSGVDWTANEYQTPHPAPKSKYGKYVQPILDIPQLPERNIRVKAKAPATYYTTMGTPIPADQWVTLPISPGLMQAIKDGDLERGEDPEDAPTPAHHPRRRHHTTTES